VDRYIARTGSTNFGYKLVMGASHLGAIVCMLCMALGRGPVALASNFVYQALCGVSSPGVVCHFGKYCPGLPRRPLRGIKTRSQSRRHHRPALTGFIVDWTGHFTLAFVQRPGRILGFIGWCS